VEPTKAEATQHGAEPDNACVLTLTRPVVCFDWKCHKQDETKCGSGPDVQHDEVSVQCLAENGEVTMPGELMSMLYGSYSGSSQRRVSEVCQECHSEYSSEDRSPRANAAIAVITSLKLRRIIGG
jgi:hypothetical protein